MYSIIKESDGTKTLYTVADMRTFKEIGTYASLEQVIKYRDKANAELYQGFGVNGNEL